MPIHHLIDSEDLKRSFLFNKNRTDTLLDNKATISRNVILIVAPDGNDETGDGSFDNPFATMNRALDALGDICYDCRILLKDGTYNWNPGNWGGTNTKFAIHCRKLGTELAVMSYSGQFTVNINITVDRTIAGWYGGCCCEGTHLFLRNLNFNFSDISSGSGSTAVFRANDGGFLEVANGSVEVSGNSEVYCFNTGCNGTILVSNLGTVNIGFIKSTNNTCFYGAYALDPSIISIFGYYGIKIKTGGSYVYPDYGNRCRSGGVIFIDKNFKWNATKAENLVSDYITQIYSKVDATT